MPWNQKLEIFKTMRFHKSLVNLNKKEKEQNRTGFRTSKNLGYSAEKLQWWNTFHGQIHLRQTYTDVIFYFIQIYIFHFHLLSESLLIHQFSKTLNVNPDQSPDKKANHK